MGAERCLPTLICLQLVQVEVQVEKSDCRINFILNESGQKLEA